MRIETIDQDREDRHVAEGELASFAADVEASELRLTPSEHDSWAADDDCELGMHRDEWDDVRSRR